MGRSIINRKSQSLGNPPHNRSLSQIRYFVWHYTATNTSFISNHERFWRDTYGWDRGGYHFYIDRQGNIYQNYDLTQTTWGVANSNSYTAHVSVEAVSKNDYTQAQLDARDWLTRYLLQGQLSHLNGNNVKGHWEVYNNTSCPGYTRSEMDVFRRQLMNGQPVSSAVSSPVGATLVKYEDGDFTVTEEDGIIVRSSPSTKASRTGGLDKGVTITYDSVYKGNGYRWLSYEGYSGNRLYVPYRPENEPDNQWGTFSPAGSVNKQAKKTAPKGNTYSVQKGDTLWGISQKYDVTVDQLKQWNNLSSDVLSVGQSLTVKANEGAVNTLGEENIYTVQSGDTLWSISQAHDTTPQKLAEWNNMTTDDILSIGQELNVQGPVDPHKEEIVHTVKKGHTLWAIAQEYDVTVNQLKEWNSLDSDVLFIGQTLQVTGPVSIASGFKSLQSGDSATIGSWATKYQTGEPISDWVKGMTLEVADTKQLEQSQSKRAHKLVNGDTVIGWVLEQDLVEADDGRRSDEIKEMEKNALAVEEGRAEVVEEKPLEEIKEEEQELTEEDVQSEEPGTSEKRLMNEGEFFLEGRKYRVRRLK